MSDPIEVWIAMNESGEYEVAADEDDAIERLDQKHGFQLRRLVRLKVVMSPPEVTELDVVVPDEAGQTVKVDVG